MRAAVLVLAVATVALSGCTLRPGLDAIDPDRPAAVFTVMPEHVRAGLCISSSGMGEGYCHTVDVIVNNSNNRQDFRSNPFTWDARDAGGAIYNTPHIEGPDAVAAGGKGTFSLGFDIDASGVMLAVIHYRQGNDEITAPIPPP